MLRNIHGGFYFKKALNEPSGRMEVSNSAPYNFAAGYSTVYFRQNCTRIYELVAGNNFAAFAPWVFSPGARPLTCAVAPWYYAASVLTTGPDTGMSTTLDQGPMFRERLAAVEIAYGDNGVATAQLQTQTIGKTTYGHDPYLNAISMVKMSAPGYNY